MHLLMVVFSSYTGVGLFVGYTAEQAKTRVVLLVSVKCGWRVTVTVMFDIVHAATCCSSTHKHS